jgi:xanthine dehydrogenase molybdopterin-binding subunit B
MTTWDTSLVRAAKDAHLAGAVLGVLAYLAADDIPHDLLLAPNAANEPLLDGGDELAVSEAIAALARYSLIDATRDASGSITALSTHTAWCRT